jgi:hypothetical protein
VSGGGTNTVSSTTIPASILPYYQSALGQGQLLDNTPGPQYYPGTQVAPLNSLQEDALSTAASGTAYANQGYQIAQQGVPMAASTYNFANQNAIPMAQSAYNYANQTAVPDAQAAYGIAQAGVPMAQSAYNFAQNTAIPQAEQAYGVAQQGVPMAEQGYGQASQDYVPTLQGLSQIQQTASQPNASQSAQAANEFETSGALLNPNSNPYLQQTFTEGAQQVQNALDSQFGAAGRNVLSSAPVQSDELNNLATQLYGGAYQQGVNTMTQASGLAPSIDAGTYMPGQQLLSASNAALGNNAQFYNAGNNVLSAGNNLMNAGNNVNAANQYVANMGNNYLAAGNNMMNAGNNVQSANAGVASLGNNVLQANQDVANMANNYLNSGTNLQGSANNLLNAGNNEMSAGAGLQNQTQNQINANMNEWNYNQQLPYNQLSWYSGLLGQNASPFRSQSSNTTGSASPWSTALGTSLVGNSLLSANGNAGYGALASLLGSSGAGIASTGAAAAGVDMGSDAFLNSIFAAAPELALAAG